MKGFTYQEFLTLWDKTIRVESLPLHPIFEVLLLATEAQRKAFISRYQPDEISYIQALIHLHSPIISPFFYPMPARLRVGDLMKHTYIAGQSGSGKSEIMKLIWYGLQSKSSGKEKGKYSLVLLDPHGDISRELVALHFNQQEKERLLYFDPFLSNEKFPVINPLETQNKSLAFVDTLAQSISNALQEKGWDFTASDNGYFGSSPRITRTIKMLQEGIGADLNMKYKDLTANAYYGNSKQRAMYFPQSWSSYTSITKNGDTSQVYKDYNAINEVFFGDLGYRKDITKNWNLAVNGTFNRTKLTEASEDANDDIAVSTSTDWIGEFTNTFKLGEKGNLLVGGLANAISGKQTFPISLKKEKTIAAPYQAVGFGSFNIYNDNLGKNPDAPYIIEPYDEVWYSGYVQADYKVLPELKLVAGGQVNKVPKIKADFVPRLGAIYNFSDEIGAKLLYGEAFRVGSSSERFIKVNFVFGNENLKPEKIRTGEFMLFFKDKDNKFNSSLTYFHSSQSNLINRSAQAAIDANLPTSEVVINTGSRISQGLEFDFVYNLNRYFNMQGSFTAMSSLDKVNAKTTAHTDTIYEVSNSQATPQSMAKVGITYTHNGIMVGLFDSFFQGTIRTNQYGTALMPRLNPAIESFHWLSAQVQLDLYKIMNTKALEGLQLSVYGKNLLNEKVMMADPQYGINTLPARGGRQIMFSVSYTFDRMGE